MAKRHKTYGEILSIGNPSKISTDKLLLAICVCSFTWIICYKFIFVYRKEVFSNASVLGEITFSLLSSVIASGLFYYLVIYLEQKKIKKTIYPVLKKKLLDISVSVPLILFALNQATKSGSQNLPNEETFTNLYKEIKLNDKPPPTLQGYNISFDSWRKFFEFHFHSIRFHLELLYRNSAFLSPILLLKLSEIQYSDFERSLANAVDFDEFTIGNSGLWNFLSNLEQLTGKDLKTLE